MLAPVTASHGLRPSASAQLSADGKCSENNFAMIRSEAMRNKPEVRNSTVRISKNPCVAIAPDLWRLTPAVSGRGERMRASGPLDRDVRRPTLTQSPDLLAPAATV